MVEVFKKIKDKQKPLFTMPFSLRIIKDCSQNGIDWKPLHIADLLSIIYSIRIDNARQYIQHQKQENMRQRGISSISKATEEDFDNL